MKKGILVLLGLTFFLSSCARVETQSIPPPVTEVPSVEPADTDTPTVPAPDFTTMNFVEKNKLYLQLLDKKSSAGADTTQAEAAYQKSIEASLNGDSETADKALEEAILNLWNLKGDSK